MNSVIIPCNIRIHLALIVSKKMKIKTSNTNAGRRTNKIRIEVLMELTVLNLSVINRAVALKKSNPKPTKSGCFMYLPLDILIPYPILQYSTLNF